MQGQGQSEFGGLQGCRSVGALREVLTLIGTLPGRGTPAPGKGKLGANRGVLIGVQVLGQGVQDSVAGQATQLEPRPNMLL